MSGLIYLTKPATALKKGDHVAGLGVLTKVFVLPKTDCVYLSTNAAHMSVPGMLHVGVIS